MFNPQEFFLPEELLPLKKRGRNLSSSSTSNLPRAFEIGESSQDKIEGLGKGWVIIQQDFDNLEAELREMPPKRTSTSEAPAMTQAAIRKLVADSVTAALEAQAATMANADNTNRNTREREAPVARKCSYKEFMSCQPINFKGSEGAVGLIRNKGPATGSNLLPVTVTCHACGEKGHYANQCRKTTNNNAQGRAYMLRDRNAHQDPNIVTNTFYYYELADGNLVSRNTVIQGVTLTLLNQPFEIDLMLIKNGSFDVVIRMDWLSKYHARIICDKKFIHIPIKGSSVYSKVDLRSGYLKCEIGMKIFPRLISEQLIKDFSKIEKSLTELTLKNKKYIWGENQESAFQLLKQKQCEAPILALPEENDDFVVYFDASHQGLGAGFNAKERRVRIYQKSQENHQKQASTDTRTEEEYKKPEDAQKPEKRELEAAFWVPLVQLEVEISRFKSNQICLHTHRVVSSAAAAIMGAALLVFVFCAIASTVLKSVSTADLLLLLL
ncbi:putative reverse transcriptase domain-containing protein [Tanacetum coccineum]